MAHTYKHQKAYEHFHNEDSTIPDREVTLRFGNQRKAVVGRKRAKHRSAKLKEDIAVQKEIEQELDNCEVCHGSKGGVLGNENLIDGVIMCDYCHYEHMKRKKDVV